jgi:carboxyl-terminal processing protease
MEAAEKEVYYEQLDDELKGLMDKVHAGESRDMMTYKKEIMEVLSEQIGFHYDLYKGQAQIFLKHDKAIAEARKVLNDPSTYHKLLSVN